MIRLSNIIKNYGTHNVLEGVNLEINPRNKLGIIGLNGSGKTTILKIINGDLEIDGGKLVKPKDLKATYVSQTLTEGLDRTILELAYAQNSKIAQIQKRLKEYEEDMASPNFKFSPDYSRILDRYSEALAEFEEEGGYNLESLTLKNLGEMGFSKLTCESKLGHLSAGELKISQIATAAGSNPDLLMIDEPTNYCDVLTSEAIDEFIRNYKSTLVYVTHDRRLLNKVQERIAEVRNKQLIEFKGTYDDFIEFRKNKFEADMRRFKAQQKEKDRLTKTVHKLKVRSANGYDKAGRTAKSIEKRIEGMDLECPKNYEDNIKISLNSESIGGNIVIRTNKLSKTIGNQNVLNKINLEIMRGERIGLIGNSGSGKTTLLNCLLGYDLPSSGEVFRGPSINVGYLSQSDINISSESTVFRELNDAGCKNINGAYGLLKRMLFSDQDINKQIGLLSGGEKKKIQLIKIMLQKPNLLVLDEPTNHLDMASRESLEEAIEDFEGTLITVSHDRHFLDKIIDKIMIIDKGNVNSFEGNYSSNLKMINKYLKK